MVEILCGFGVFVLVCLSFYVFLEWIGMNKQPFDHYERPIYIGMIFAEGPRRIRLSVSSEHKDRVSRELNDKSKKWQFSSRPVRPRRG